MFYTPRINFLETSTSLFPGVGKIKSNRRENDFMSNQIKSRTFLRGVKSNQIMIFAEKTRPNQIKSNHDLIPFSNQNFGRDQNQAIKRSKLRLHRQIWRRSKALGELFPSVPLVLPGATFSIENLIDNDFPISNQIMRKRSSNQIKSRGF